MKTKLQKLIGTAVVGVALCVTHMPAWAGFTLDGEVVISAGIRSMHGSLPAARYSTDSKQFLSCSNWSTGYASCDGRDSSGRSFLCYSSDARFVEALRGMTAASYVNVKRAASGTCTDLEIDNASDYLR